MPCSLGFALKQVKAAAAVKDPPQAYFPDLESAPETELAGAVAEGGRQALIPSSTNDGEWLAAPIPFSSLLLKTRIQSSVFLSYYTLCNTNTMPLSDRPCCFRNRKVLDYLSLHTAKLFCGPKLQRQPRRNSTSWVTSPTDCLLPAEKERVNGMLISMYFWA